MLSFLNKNIIILYVFIIFSFLFNFSLIDKLNKGNISKKEYIGCLKQYNKKNLCLNLIIHNQKTKRF